jgi:hypothetical protein
MKKLLALVAILGLTVSFIGCEAKKEAPKKTETPAPAAGGEAAK